MSERGRSEDSREREAGLEQLSQLQQDIYKAADTPPRQGQLIEEWMADFKALLDTQLLTAEERRRLHEWAIANANLYDFNIAPTIPDIDLQAGQAETTKQPGATEPPKFHWKFGIPMTLDIWEDTQPLASVDAPPDLPDGGASPGTPPEPPPTDPV